jgi:cobalt-zinc-cadmium efflux system membrane fusion protein
MNLGKYINSNDVMFELIDPDDLHLILTVYEKDIHVLEVGQTVFAYSNSNPSEKYECEIILISRSIGNTEAAEVNCHFKTTKNKLLPGTFMNAEVLTRENFVPSLPDDAIISFENQTYIFVDQGNRNFKMVPVIIGSNENGFTEILNAEQLKNEKIVFKGAYTLLMSLKNTGDE